MAVLTPYQIAGGLGAVLVGQPSGGPTGLPAPVIAKPINSDLLDSTNLCQTTPVINQDPLIAPTAAAGADVTVGFPTS
jgi:hypothetical protein